MSPKVATQGLARAPVRPVTMIPYGVPLPMADTAEWSAPTDRIELVYVGRLDDAQKGTSRLPEILEGCHRCGLDAALTVSGDGPDREALDAEIARRGLGHRAALRGSMGPHGVYEALARAHILLLPSRHEGFGIVLLEAQVNGCVPIASRLLGVTGAAVVDGKTGFLVDPHDPDVFADAVVRIGRDPTRWREMAEAGRARGARDLLWMLWAPPTRNSS